MDPTNVREPNYFHKVVDCQWACPAHTNVPEYIRMIAQGRFADAYILNRASNVFPGILGRTCDRPCEPACRRGRLEGEKPVAICRLKRVASDLRGDIRDPPASERPRRRDRDDHRHGRRRPLRGSSVAASRRRTTCACAPSRSAMRSISFCEATRRAVEDLARPPLAQILHAELCPGSDALRKFEERYW